MVTLKSVEKQLKRIRFNHTTWNRAEALELANILLPDEEIYECVNGTYEGGFALLCATNVRMLLIDKKPLNFLTVEDLRFDMINQIDYSHRIFGARISVSAGSKNLKFMSFNQPRLRKLIGHVQHCMAESKKEQSHNAESQQQHLEQINQQLQAYLIAQQQQQDELRKQLQDVTSSADNTTKSRLLEQPKEVKPSPQLADYLFAQTLLNQYQASQQQQPKEITADQPATVAQTTHFDPAIELPKSNSMHGSDTSAQLADLYAAGMQEIFGKVPAAQAEVKESEVVHSEATPMPSVTNPLELNPLRIAYSKLPMALRDRAFVRRAGALKHVTPQPLSD